MQTLDYMELFQKFGYTYGPQESYALNHIAYVVLGEKKLSYEESGSLKNLYKDLSIFLYSLLVLPNHVL